jgi:hypothetical protein
MTCALPEMVVPTAFCRSAVDDEDSMSEMACCSMNTRKVGRAEDVDRSGGRRG